MKHKQSPTNMRMGGFKIFSSAARYCYTPNSLTEYNYL